MNSRITPGRLLAAAIVALSLWIVHGYLQALIAASVLAVASWPLYAGFRARLPRRVGATAAAAVFTCAMTVFVLAPGVFAAWALLHEGQVLAVRMTALDPRGLVVPAWLANAPVLGPSLLAGWPAQPGALAVLMQRTDAAAVFGWAESVGLFTARQLLTVGFTMLLLAFLYRHGDSLAEALARMLRESVDERADRYLAVTTRAVRASVGSIVVVGLFDAIATALAYTALGAPRALVWAAITGAVAAVPFLGYVAVAAMALELALQGFAPLAPACFFLGAVVLLCGDKFVRPLAARGGMRLPFALALMGCIGGFEALGLAGLVTGPVALALARELWLDRMRPVPPGHVDHIPTEPRPRVHDFQGTLH
jgi:predicted PurR-regulated permease PerM